MVQLTRATDKKAGIVFHYVDEKATRALLNEMMASGYVAAWSFEGDRVVMFPGERRLTREEVVGGR